MLYRLSFFTTFIVLMAACSGPSAPRVDRFIDPPPRRLLSVDDLGVVVPVAATDFETAVDGWTQLQPAATVRNRKGGWPLQFSEPVIRMEWKHPLISEQVQLISVEIADLRAGRVDLLWKRQGEEYGTGRRVRVQVQDARGGPLKRFDFNVGGHPEWRGPVEAIRLDISFPGGSRSLLRRVTANRIVSDQQRTARVLGRPWKIDLGHDVRPALLVPPHSPFEREVSVGERARLIAGYGLMPGYAGGAELRISATSPDMTPELLFSVSIDSNDPERFTWRNAVVDLSRFAGRRLKIRLEALADDADRGFAMPVWANPMILTPRRGRSPINVVLMSADTLRADRLSLYGNTRRTSPYIDRWAMESAVVMRHVVVQSPWTLPSHVSMLTGLEAPRHGVNHDLRIVPEELVLMAEALRDAGWVTCAVTGGGFLHPRYGFDQGFDSYYYWPEKGSSGELEAVIQRATEWMTEFADFPFFLFLHSYEVHGPFRVRQPYYEQFVADGAPPAPPNAVVSLRAENPLRSEGFLTRDQEFVWQSGSRRGELVERDELPVVVAMYDSGVAHLDAQFGRLLEHAAGLGLDDRTLLVFTSDHGEALGEHGRGGHGYLYESNLLVPLVLAFPDHRFAGRVIDDQVRSIDILPTILDELGLGGSDDLDGASLMPLINGGGSDVPRDAWTYASAFNLGVSLRIANGVKYTFNNTAWREIYGQRSVYDLESEPDDSLGRPPSDSERHLLDGKMSAAFNGVTRGLIMDIRNSEEAPISGTISGNAVSPNGVASWGMVDASVEWIRRGQLRFHVGENGVLNLVFEKWDGRVIEMKGGLQGSDVEFQEEISADSARYGVSVQLGPSGWNRSPTSEAPSGTGIFVSVVGAESGDSGSPLENDEQLQQRLRALGYLQ